VPNDSIELNSFGSIRTVSITPLTNRIGTATITIQVSDATGQTAASAFVVTVSQFVDVQLRLPSLEGGATAWGDYDDDGDLDFVIMGKVDSTTNREPVTVIYRNDGNGVFTPIEANLLGLYHGSVMWGDFANRGRLDLLQVGCDANREPSFRLYRNQGGDSFVDIGTGLPGVTWASAVGGDFDNDGRLDIFITGSATNLFKTAPLTRLYHNNSDGTFSDTEISFPQGYDGTAAWGDYDDDGNLDIIVAQHLPGGHQTKVFHNNGSSSFTETGFKFPGESALAAAAWGDYDNDGFPDILRVYGVGMGVFHNEHGTNFTSISTGIFRPAQSGAAWGDFDNDGRLDIVQLPAYPGTRVYHNNGDNTFTNVFVGIPEVVGTAAWGDFDNDGRLDLLVIGIYGSHLYRNYGVVSNTPPRAPSNLSATILTNRTVRFSWERPSDLQTANSLGLNFNVRVGSNVGAVDIVAPHADLLTGKRRVAQMGNAGSSGTYVLKKLPPGTYYWSVQAIDTAFAASTFAPEAKFVVTNSAPLATDMFFVLAENSSSPISIAARDAEGDQLFYAILSRPANANLDLFTEFKLPRT